MGSEHDMYHKFYSSAHWIAEIDLLDMGVVVINESLVAVAGTARGLAENQISASPSLSAVVSLI